MNYLDDYQERAKTISSTLLSVIDTLKEDKIEAEIDKLVTETEDLLSTVDIFCRFPEVSDVAIDQWSDYKRITIQLRSLVISEYYQFISIATGIDTNGVHIHLTREFKLNGLLISIAWYLDSKFPLEEKKLLRDMGVIRYQDRGETFSPYYEVIQCGGI